MDQVQAMRIFTRIVELGSFSRAAERLQLPRATVSNALKRLEQRLGAPADPHHPPGTGDQRRQPLLSTLRTAAGGA